MKDRSKPALDVVEAEFDVPSEGTYQCELKIRLKKGKDQTTTRKFQIRDFLIVSIGDSYASGEGNPDRPGKPKPFDPDLNLWDVVFPLSGIFKLTAEARDWGWDKLKLGFTTLTAAAGGKIEMDPHPIWLEPNAHRSMQSGHARGARAIEDVNKGNLVTFLSFARSGATINGGLLKGRTTEDGKPIDGWIGNIGQLEELEAVQKQRPIDGLIISIGGNDVGFSKRLKDLVNDGAWKVFLETGDDADKRDLAVFRFREELKFLETEWLPDLKAELDKFNIRNTFITEYPIAMFEKMINGEAKPVKGCEIFSSEFFDGDITGADAKKIREMGTELNQVIEKFANENDWIYIGGIAEGFSGRGYCAGADRMYVQAEESLVKQGDTIGTMHPNSDGHIWIGKQVEKQLRKSIIDPIQPSLDKETSGVATK